jgi:hypothetical protein
MTDDIVCNALEQAAAAWCEQKFGRRLDWSFRCSVSDEYALGFKVFVGNAKQGFLTARMDPATRQIECDWYSEPHVVCPHCGNSRPAWVDEFMREEMTKGDDQ